MADEGTGVSLAAALGEGTTKPDNVVRMTKGTPPLSSTSHAKNIGEVHLIQIPKYGMLPTPRVAKKPDVRTYLPGIRTQVVQQTNQ